MATAPQIPFGQQAQLDTIARKRKMAEALFAQSAQYGLPETKGRMAARANPLEALTKALGMYLGGKQLGGLDQEQQALGGQIESQQAAQAAASRKSAMIEALIKATGDRARPDSVRQTLVGEDPAALDFYSPSVEPANIAGMPGVIETSPTGKQDFSHKPVATSITVDTVGKAGLKANEQGAQHFMYGGKGREQYDSLLGKLNVTKNILDTLEANPQMGSGAEIFQLARKWAETLGVPANAVTTPTEMAKMQLGQMVLERLGGLGAQVSDADRKFMMETQGSLTNDPEALRRMMLLEAKYTMQVVDKLRQGRDDMQRLLGNATNLPEYFFSMPFSEKNDADMQRLFKGQGFAPAVQSKPGAAVPPGTPSRFKPVGR